MPGADQPIIDFSAHVTERTRHFAGRDWVFQAIDRWLADPAGAPLFLLTGEPGAGKSAMAARLALISSGAVPPPDGAGRLQKGFLSAVHFCSARDRRWINPHVFAESLAQQLSDRYASYALALLRSVAPTISISQDVRENWGRMVAAEIGTLVVTASPEDLFDRIVREPLEVLARDQLAAPVTVLVDALDESLAYSGTVSVADLVAQADNLPDAVRFIVTCRPKSELMRSLQRRSPQQHTLSPRPTRHAETDGASDAYARVLRDVQDYVERVVRDEAPTLSDWLAANLSPQQFVATIRDKSEGNFLYVRYLLPMMLDRQGPITLEALAAVPAGLDAIYLEFVQRLVPTGARAWHSEYGKVLGVLAVGQVPLTEDQIANFTALSPAATRVALHKLHELLEFDEGQPASQRVHSLYHRSLADFLLDRDRAEEYWLDDVSIHRLISAYYWTTRTAGRWTCDEYGLRFLATHLFAGRETARLQSLVDEDWIRLRYARRHYSYDGVLDDVELAWRAAEQTNQAQIANSGLATYVSQEVRWALIISSIASLAGGIPADVLGALVGRGEWSPLQALAYARHAPAGEPRSKALASLAAHLSEPLRTDAFVESTAAARQIPDTEQRARVLTWLLSQLPPDPRTEALIDAIAAVRELTDRRRIAGGYGNYYSSGEGEKYVHTGVRTKALAELGEVLAGLSGTKLSQAEAIAELGGVCAEDDEQFRAAVAVAATRLAGGPSTTPEPQPEPWSGPSLLAEITARASIGDVDERAQFAADFAASTLTDPDYDLAAQVAAVRSVRKPYYQAAKLAALAPRLPEAVLPDALDIAHEIEDVDAHTRVMSGLAPHLPLRLLGAVLSQIIPDSENRIARPRSRDRPLKRYKPYTTSDSVAYRLAPLVRYLPEPLLREAFNRAADLDDYQRAGVLAVLAPHLAETFATDAQAFLRQAITRPMNDEWPPQAVAELVLLLPPALAADAFPVVRHIADHGSMFGTPPFILPVLLALVPDLPEPQRGEAIARGRKLIGYGMPSIDVGALGGVGLVARTLHFARQLPASAESDQLVEAVARRAISEAKKATHGRGYVGWNLRARIGLLIDLLPHLPEPYLTEAAGAAVRLIVEEFADPLPVEQTATLGAYLPKTLLADAEPALTVGVLASYLPEELVAAALDVARRRRNVSWLFAVTQRLDPSMLPEALRVAHEVGGAALQARLLADCSRVFARLAPEVLYPAWCDTLRGMANLHRPVFLRHLRGFGPVVAALAGPPAVEEVRQAVDQVGRWWR